MVNLSKVFANRKVQFAILAVVISLAIMLLKDGNPSTLDLNYGIEFVGGVRIPVTLEQKVDPATMTTIVDTVKQRINKYGLSQSVVRPLGDQEVVVEIPRAKASVIQSVQNILKEQGHFEAIIDGKVALTGEDILTSAVGGAQGERITPNGASTSWELDFAASRQGGERFSKAALDKADFPVFMFLDRPTKAAILLSHANHMPSAVGADKAVEDALRKEGDDLVLMFEEDYSKDKLAAANVTTVVVSEKLAGRNASIFKELNSTYHLLVKTEEEMVPVVQTSKGTTSMVKWPAIGLLSGPVLSAGLANGYVSQFYSVSGAASGATSEEQDQNAALEIKQLKSVISGGRLPVATSIGSAYTVEASLGSQFLEWSAIGFVLAALAVSALIMIRYRRISLAVPIILTNLAEVVILTAVVGTLGTIDLAAMAGIITLVGQGVDDQIVIADEVLRKRVGGEEHTTNKERDVRERVLRAFRVILTVASVSIVTMIPLLLSGVVEITGFAFAAILGVIIGVAITRPAFSVLIEEMFGQTAGE